MSITKDEILLFEDIKVGTVGSTYLFGLIPDRLRRTACISTPDGTECRRRIGTSRGYMDFFVSDTWIITNSSDDSDNLRDFPAVVKSIDEKMIHIVPAKSSDESAFSRVTGGGYKLTGTNLRAYYPLEKEGVRIGKILAGMAPPSRLAHNLAAAA